MDDSGGKAFLSGTMRKIWVKQLRKKSFAADIEQVSVWRKYAFPHWSARFDRQKAENY